MSIGPGPTTFEINQALFKRISVGQSGDVGGEVAEPFDTRLAAGRACQSPASADW
jgi:hypothetical protein